MPPALILLLAAGCAPPADSAATAIDSSPPAPFDPYAAGLQGDVRRGQGLFPSRCAACHGLDGGGRIGPDLGSVVGDHDDLGLYRVLTEGAGAMPAIDLAPQEGVDLVAYLRATFGGTR